MAKITQRPTVIWRKPERQRWEWTFDEVPAIGGTEYSVEIRDGKLFWSYQEDRWGWDQEQLVGSFLETGPLCDVPVEVLREMSDLLKEPGR